MKSAVFGVENSLNCYRWVQKEAPEPLLQEMLVNFDVPEIVARVLVSRGINKENAAFFLHPSMKEHLPNPSLLKDMDKAVARVAEAVRNNEKIAIFGDYDVDGATSSSLLYLFLKEAGLQEEPILHIPNRDDGYGPNLLAMEKFLKEGVSLIITVDCGTTADEALNFVSAKGIDVIVLDHHEPDLLRTPKVFALVNPKQIDEVKDNIFCNMAAVGVVFMFVIALNRALKIGGWYDDKPSSPDLRKWLDILALGTVCDVVSLMGINRLFVKSGLKYFARRNNLGLSTLADVAGIKEPPCVYHLGFVLGPRINAAGRVGDASLGAKLICSKDKDVALDIAKKLDEMNLSRKDIESGVFIEAIEQIETTCDEDNPSIVFAYAPNWHAGVIGIVAGRLKERYKVPAFVLCKDGDEIHASCRSIAGVDIGLAVSRGVEKGILLRGGGHTMAAGFSLLEDKLAEARQFFAEEVSRQVKSLEGGQTSSELLLDGVLDINAVNLSLLEKLSLLEPYGEGNAEPLFALKEVSVAYSDLKGSGLVVCTLVGRAGGSVRAVAFRAADTLLGKSLLENKGRLLNVAGYLRANTWNGQTTPQFVIVDAAFC